MLSYRLEKAHQKYQQTIENIAAENSKLRNQVSLHKNYKSASMKLLR